MREVLIFAEDAGHESVLVPLIQRFASAYGIEVAITLRNTRGGHGRALTELSRYIRALRRSRADLPDLVVVAIDGNCRGYARRKQEIDEIVGEIADFVVSAIPDPHIERWLLLDSVAFKEVVGRGCAAPDLKCERDRYKKLLIQAVRAAGITPIVGGLEFAEELVRAMNFRRVEGADASLGRLLTGLREKFEGWQQ
jgi:hypothetical protein